MEVRALQVLELNHTEMNREVEEQCSLSSHLVQIVKDQQLLWVYFANIFKAF